MAAPKTYLPSFPYTGDQVAISSGRLIFHAKDDSAFIFAKNSIGISTSGSFHVNANTLTHINSSEIKLGLNAQERVIKGDTAVDSFRRLYRSLDDFAVSIGGISETNFAESLVEVQRASQNLSDLLKNLQESLPDLLSNTTKTL